MVMIRVVLMGIVAAGLVMASAAPAQAVERRVWRHDGGFFENTKGNEWYERSPNGTFRFKESKRAEDFIELENIDGTNRVRLLDNRCIKVDTNGNEIKEYY